MNPPMSTRPHACSCQCAGHSFSSLEPVRLLVAEDDPCVSRLIYMVLTGAGFEVGTVSDGEAAWNALHHEHFDLLVTDNEMPRLSGLNLIGRMRREGMSLPVIMTSGSFLMDTVPDAADLQISALLPKPFDPMQLLSTVRHALPPSDEDNDLTGLTGAPAAIHPFSARPYSIHSTN